MACFDSRRADDKYLIQYWKINLALVIVALQHHHGVRSLWINSPIIAVRFLLLTHIIFRIGIYQDLGHMDRKANQTIAQCGILSSCRSRNKALTKGAFKE